jgi:Emfourin
LRVSVVRGGGITGLVATTVLESDSLSDEDADELRKRVARVTSDVPEDSRQDRPPARPDEQSVLLAIDSADGRHTVRAPESELSEAQRSLIDLVTSSPQREERLGSPGEQP